MNKEKDRFVIVTNGNRYMVFVVALHVLHKLGFPTVCTAKAVKYRNAHLMQLKLVSDYLNVITKQCVDVEGGVVASIVWYM
jgi:hypothetical protein